MSKIKLRSHFPHLCALVSVMAAGTLTCAPVGASSTEAAQATAEHRVAELIEDLGAAEFAEREKAHTELSQLGLVAFEALEAVKDHEDIEIRLRARRLLQGLRGRLILGTDNEAVRELLGEYDQLDEDQRQQRLTSITALEPDELIPVLCRLARFEESEALSKQAALLAMRQDVPEDEPSRLALVESIHRTCGMSRRTSVEWLRAFARSVGDPRSALKAWQQFVVEEQTSLENASRGTSEEIVRELKRTQVVTLSRSGLDDEALLLTSQLVEGSSSPHKELSRTIDVLGKRSAWPLILRLAEQQRQLFDSDRLLLYGEAQAHRNAGDLKTANSLAERARQMPLKLAGGHPEQAVELAQRSWQLQPSIETIHFVVAIKLQELGLFEWAEREYRGALSKDANFIDVRTRFLLSEMLHDQQQDEAAAEILKPLVDRLGSDAKQRDAKVHEAILLLGRMDGSVKSRMFYFAARHAEANGDREKQIEHLQKGAAADARDGDVLIAMYRLPNAPEAWKTNTKTLIRAASRNFIKAIQRNRMELEKSVIEQQRTLYRARLAKSLNEFAWLVGNTEGDYEEALRSSKESLQLLPGTAGYLDTLGRCFYVLGDFENAVKYQRQAVRREPFSGQIKRQLRQFEEALTNSQQEPET